MHMLLRLLGWFFASSLALFCLPGFAESPHRWDGQSWILDRPALGLESEVRFQAKNGQQVSLNFATDEAIRLGPEELALLGLNDGEWAYTAHFKKVEYSPETVGRASDSVFAPIPPKTGDVLIKDGKFVTREQSITTLVPKTADSDLGDPRQLIDDLLVVTQGLCVGTACLSNEVLSFDTIKLREDNVRISFIDHSAAAGFASGDWQLRANESGNLGANVFAIDWLGTAATVGDVPLKTPFLVAESAPADGLVIKGSGANALLGIGTNDPKLNLHVDSGDTPALRLQQNTSEGWQDSTWDVAGNETNFFIRSAFSGAPQLPFRIRPGAPTSSLEIAASGRVGIGTASPEAKLHVASGDLRVDGAIYQLSSSTSKTPFERVNPTSLLEKLSHLELGRWGYKDRSDAGAHFGPAAEDFFALFGLGEGSNAIAVSDMAGIALGASQALHDELKQKELEIKALEGEVHALSTRLAKLEHALLVNTQQDQE